jgi:hypothetical protein
MEAGRLARKLARVTAGGSGAHLREAPTLVERTWVGLAVHARSVVASAIDELTGEVRTLRLSPRTPAIVEWVLVGWVGVTASFLGGGRSFPGTGGKALGCVATA